MSRHLVSFCRIRFSSRLWQWFCFHYIELPHLRNCSFMSGNTIPSRGTAAFTSSLHLHFFGLLDLARLAPAICGLHLSITDNVPDSLLYLQPCLFDGRLQGFAKQVTRAGTDHYATTMYACAPSWPQAQRERCLPAWLPALPMREHAVGLPQIAQPEAR